MAALLTSTSKPPYVCWRKSFSLSMLSLSMISNWWNFGIRGKPSLDRFSTACFPSFSLRADILREEQHYVLFSMINDKTIHIIQFDVTFNNNVYIKLPVRITSPSNCLHNPLTVAYPMPLLAPVTWIKHSFDDSEISEDSKKVLYHIWP